MLKNVETCSSFLCFWNSPSSVGGVNKASIAESINSSPIPK